MSWLWGGGAAKVSPRASSSSTKQASPAPPKKEVVRVSLAYRSLTEIHPNFAKEFGATIHELDLTFNNLENDFTILSEFKVLNTLILDNNKLTSLIKFPRHPTIHTLWMNNNMIDNLTVLCNKLVGAFPSLKILSMLNNPACPNFFNDGTPAQYRDYRLYVLSRLPGLAVLDSTPITEAERVESKAKYSSPSVNFGTAAPLSVLAPNANPVETVADKEANLVTVPFDKKKLKKKKKRRTPKAAIAPPSTDVIPSIDELERGPQRRQPHPDDLPAVDHLDAPMEFSDKSEDDDFEEDWSDDEVFDPMFLPIPK